jgi:hypothetical protein
VVLLFGLPFQLYISLSSRCLHLLLLLLFLLLLLGLLLHLCLRLLLLRCYTSRNLAVPWTVLNITKLAISLTLVLVPLIDLIYVIYLYTGGEVVPQVKTKHIIHNDTCYIMHNA